MATVLTEGFNQGDWLKWEMDGRMSRKEVTIASGRKLVTGTVLGKISLGAATATAYTGNAANTGTCGTVTVGAGAQVGTYKVTIIEPGTNTGKFTVEDPQGVTVGVGTVASAFSGGGLGFTIADGATDFSAGEGFSIAVAAGSGKYVGLDKDATDGSAVAVGILLETVDATSADVKGAMLYQQARIDTRGLTWVDAGANEKAAALLQLATSGIVAGQIG